MVFDWTLNVASLIALMGMFFGLISAYYIVKSDIRTLDNRITDQGLALAARLTVTEVAVRDQIRMNAQIIAEVGAVRQDVAVIRDRLEPPPMSVQSPSRGSQQ